MALPAVTPLPHHMRPRRALPSDTVRPTRVEINLGNLRHNLHVLRRYAGTAEIFGVLKADAYGHGAPSVARSLERAGVNGICVALLEEAVELREAGVRTPILVLGGYYGNGWDTLLAHQITPVIYEPSHIEALAREVRYHDLPAFPVHLKVDTGMSRLGVRPENLAAILRALSNHPEVRLDGMMTHFANADADDLSSTNQQCRLFDRAVEAVRRQGFSPRVLHASNSAGLLRVDSAHYDMVRPGIALFGVSPKSSEHYNLRPVMRVRSEIVSMRTVQQGDSSGYGSAWKAQRISRLATVPIGYADGISRSLSNRGRVLVRGRSAPIIGNVSMDLITVDVTDIPGASIRDEVVIIGRQSGPLGHDSISVHEIAEMASTIPWEIMTGVTRRVPRFYREP